MQTLTDRIRALALWLGGALVIAAAATLLSEH